VCGGSKCDWNTDSCSTVLLQAGTCGLRLCNNLTEFCKEKMWLVRTCQGR
jgi:hypothetical protein